MTSPRACKGLIALLVVLGVAAGSSYVAAAGRDKAKSDKATAKKATKEAPKKDAAKKETKKAEPAPVDAAPADDETGLGDDETGLGDAGGDAAADKSDAQPKAARPANEIMQELQQTGPQVGPIFAAMQQGAFADEQRRQELAETGVPVLKRLIGLFEELAVAQPQAAEEIGGQRYMFMGVLSALGDEDTKTELEKLAGSEKEAEAIGGKSAQLFSRWVTANDDDARGKVVDDLSTLAKAHPEDNNLAGLAMMMSQIGGGSPAVSDRITEVITNDLRSPLAQQVARQANAQKTMKSLEGKELTLEGKTVDGKDFTTADWRGKVILVDFWATWCGPCLQELPRVKAAYKEYHDKGLEILGVSCDNDVNELKQFVEQNPDMPWPHLFDETNPGWHPLATQFGIQGIPTMFLIDRKGVVRSVTARQNFEQMIPQLLAEEAGDAAGAGAGAGEGGENAAGKARQGKAGAGKAGKARQGKAAR